MKQYTCSVIQCITIYTNDISFTKAWRYLREPCSPIALCASTGVYLENYFYENKRRWRIYSITIFGRERGLNIQDSASTVMDCESWTLGLHSPVPSVISWKGYVRERLKSSLRKFYGSHQAIWGPPLPNVTRHSGWWPHTVTPSIDRTLHQFLTITDLDLITEFDFLPNCARFP